LAGLNRNLSRLELALMITVIALLITIAINRTSVLFVEAERLSVDMTLNSLRNGIIYYTAERMMQGQMRQLAKLDGANPVGLVIVAPKGYRGALKPGQAQKLKPGDWYFDTVRGVLVYLVVNRDHLRLENGGRGRLEFRLGLDFRDRNGNGHFDQGVDSINGLGLVTVTPYHWDI